MIIIYCNGDKQSSVVRNVVADMAVISIMFLLSHPPFPTFFVTLFSFFVWFIKQGNEPPLLTHEFIKHASQGNR